MFRGKALEKLARPDLMVFKALELSHRPGYERPVDVPQQGVQRRWGVSSVVLDPTPQEWIELLGDVLCRPWLSPVMRKSLCFSSWVLWLDSRLLLTTTQRKA
jgi:hypothetical protein